MNGRDKRRARADRARRWEDERAICTACGGQGRHFVPPSFGEPGYFSCPLPPKYPLPRVLMLKDLADVRAPSLEELRHAFPLPGVQSIGWRGRGG